MLEEYLNVITNMENYVDGVLVVDQDAKVVYMNQFRPDYTPLDEKRSLGRSLFDIYPDLKPESSTIMAALRTGKVTLGNEELLTTSYGKSFRIFDNTFPIREDGEIIGAVSVATFFDSNTMKLPIEVFSGAEKIRRNLYTVSDMIGRSPAMQEVRKAVKRVGQTSSSVLIYGSTGTGKELVAQSIHTSSSRKGKPFLSQNCAAIPASLLESLFFGTVKGSFTGAEDKAGIFENAEGGTVFLDEINSMDLNLQAKLLRVLEERRVSRVGSTEEIPVNVRIIAAVNEDPMACIQKGTMRADLFYRLGSVTIDLPDLKERKEDIALLTEYFISSYNNAMHRKIIGVSQEVMGIFMTYSWPGNVREFRNVIEGAFNLCEGTIISKADLPSYMMQGMEPEALAASPERAAQLPWTGSLKENLEAYEKLLIEKALEEQENYAQAARSLGITRQALNQKLNKYQLKKRI